MQKQYIGSSIGIKYSFEDYLEIEFVGDTRYEFYDGELFEVDNTSISHNRILANAFGKIAAFLNGKTCEVFAAKLKIHVKKNGFTGYPDITIVCSPLQTLKGHTDIVTNPTVIIEIISASTGDYDHGTKFRLYRDLPSLKEYILIDSLQMLVEKFTKQENRLWTMQEYDLPEEILLIDSIDFQIALSDIYRKVEFELQ